jgi:hypothetical protein
VSIWNLLYTYTPDGHSTTISRANSCPSSHDEGRQIAMKTRDCLVMQVLMLFISLAPPTEGNQASSESVPAPEE